MIQLVVRREKGTKIMMTEKAFNVLEQFLNSSRIGVWPYVDKQDLLDNIENNIKNPYLVQSLNLSLCGPTVLLFELIRRKPERYVEICQSLYETGAFQANELLIEPEQKLRNSRIRHNISPADWMLLATLHEVEKKLFGGENRSQSYFISASTPEAVANWSRYLLDFDIVEIENTSLYGQIEALQRANQIISFNGAAFLLVDESLINIEKGKHEHPYCWITLLNSTEISQDDSQTFNNQIIVCDSFSDGSVHHLNLVETAVEDKINCVILAQ